MTWFSYTLYKILCEQYFFLMSKVYVNIFHFWGCALNTFDSLVICFMLLDWIHNTKYTYFYVHFYQFNTPLKAPKRFKYTILEKKQTQDWITTCILYLLMFLFSLLFCYSTSDASISSLLTLSESSDSHSPRKYCWSCNCSQF